eukprot:scaffold1060_cov196-Amphora_coffeaeformis.AAC.3
MRKRNWRFGIFLIASLLLELVRPSASLATPQPTDTTTKTKLTEGTKGTLIRNQYKQSPEDDFFRSLRQKTPPKFQYFLRDSGLLRFLVDTLTWTTAVPAMVREYPQAVGRFLQLSGFPQPLVSLVQLLLLVNNVDIGNDGSSSASQKVDPQVVGNDKEVDFTNIRYGRHPRQSIDVMKLVPESSPSSSTASTLLLFVHGGAWGSGSKEVYRLMAAPFLERDTTIAVLGYRTYPDGYVQDQVDDVVEAFRTLKAGGLIGTTTRFNLMGHSSGAHLSAMALLSDRELREATKCFVSLSGVYDIPSHYQYERLRGVERVSPMAVACAGPSVSLLQAWKRQSPTRVAQSDVQLESFPDTLVYHGEKDTTVPTESASRFAESLQNALKASTTAIVLAIQPEVGHVDVMTQLMFGGISRDIVLNWMDNRGAIDSLKRID